MAVIMVPGLGDQEWADCRAKLSDFGLAADTMIAIGPLLRFTAKRWEET